MNPPFSTKTAFPLTDILIIPQEMYQLTSAAAKPIVPQGFKRKRGEKKSETEDFTEKRNINKNNTKASNSVLPPFMNESKMNSENKPKTDSPKASLTCSLLHRPAASHGTQRPASASVGLPPDERHRETEREGGRGERI